MAYAFTTVVTQVGPREWLVTIDERDCGPTDEAQIGTLVDQGVPLVGTVKRQTVVKTLGSATNVNGILGEVPDPPANPTRVIVENDPTNQPLPLINDTQGIATYFDPTPTPGGTWGILFHRSRPDVGADNVIRSTYHIVAQW